MLVVVVLELAGRGGGNSGVGGSGGNGGGGCSGGGGGDSCWLPWTCSGSHPESSGWSPGMAPHVPQRAPRHGCQGGRL